MPTSFPSNLAPIVDWCVELQPASVLDVGVGWGKYGVLLREYLDEWRCDVRIDGVEPWGGYRTPAWDAYDEVYHGVFPGTSTGRGDYDLVLMIDVLEHYERREGLHALKRALEVAPLVLVSTPWEPADQHAVYGNEWETHRSRWRAHDLRAFRCEHRDTPDSLMLLARR